MTPLDREPLFSILSERGLNDWSAQLRQLCLERYDTSAHGLLPGWLETIGQLPAVDDASIDASGDAVCVTGTLPPASAAELSAALMTLRPWRKGPFNLFGTLIDTEWRSDLKWRRLAESVDLRGRTVLDVGSGNGYYGWKMLAAGADLVVGLDPFLLYNMQFEVVRRYAIGQERHFVLPLADTDLPDRLNFFDVACSMGVLYHRTSPIDHLQALWQSLRPNGQLILESLVLTDDSETVLVPKGRYAKMRNVWFIPSIPMLRRWLERTGFREIEIVDVTATTNQEQRRTEWMTFESLDDFLMPGDPSRTIEGYQGPVRTILTARRS